VKNHSSDAARRIVDIIAYTSHQHALVRTTIYYWEKLL